MDINLEYNTIYNIYGEFDARNSSLKNVKEYDFFIKALALHWLHPEDKYKFISLFSKAALITAYNNHKSFVSMDFRTMASGEASWLKLSVYLRKIENDIIAYMFCSDINQYYDNDNIAIDYYLDNDNYGVINIDSNYKVINANDLAAKIHNYTDVNDLLPRIHNGVVDSIYVHDKNQVIEKLSLLINHGDHQTIDYRILLQNGDYKYISCNAIVKKYKDNTYIQLLSFDNTAQKKLELDLIYQESLKELKSLNTSNENKAFFIGINKVYESIYFCNINLNSYISIKHPTVLNPYIADSNTYDELIAKYSKDFVSEEDLEKVLLMTSREYLKNHLTKNNEKVMITYRRKTLDGYNWFKLDLVASTFDPSGSIENIILLVTNIHDEMKLTLSYKNEMEQYKELFINSTSEIYTDMLFINLDTFYAIKTMFKDNSVVEEAFNRPWNKVYRDLLKIVGDEYINVIKDNLSIESLTKLQFGDKKSFRYSTKSKNNARWFTSTIRVIEVRGVKHAVVFSMDITKDFNELLYARRNSEYDGLTMLYNRRKLASLIDNDYQKLNSCGVIFFDINGLKEVNDNNGHQAGDMIIKIAADSIKSVEDEYIHGFRYGGDEFLVIICDESEDFLKSLVDKIKENIDKQNQSSPYKCKIAIGTSYSDKYINVDDLISVADAIMYKEKNKMNDTNVTSKRDHKIDLLLKFLSSEYDAIYEIDFKNDTCKILESGNDILLNDIQIHGSYTNLINNYYTRYSHSNEELNIFSIESLSEKLKEQESITFIPNTIDGSNIKLSYRCISYDENDNPEIVILTINL